MVYLFDHTEPKRNTLRCTYRHLFFPTAVPWRSYKRTRHKRSLKGKNRGAQKARRCGVVEIDLDYLEMGRPNVFHEALVGHREDDNPRVSAPPACSQVLRRTGRGAFTTVRATLDAGTVKDVVLPVR